MLSNGRGGGWGCWFQFQIFWFGSLPAARGGNFCVGGKSNFALGVFRMPKATKTKTESKTSMAGYSGTPLVKKLGIKAGFNVVFVNAPEGFARRVELPAGVVPNRKTQQPVDFVLLFVKSEKE